MSARCNQIARCIGPIALLVRIVRILGAFGCPHCAYNHKTIGFFGYIGGFRMAHSFV